MNKLPDFKHFYFVRHGRTEANEKSLMAGGKNNIPLIPHGHEQARKAAQVIKALCPDVATICASTMIRAQETADYIRKETGAPLVHVPELIEWCFGDWENQPWEEIAPKFLAEEEPPNGESRQEFKSRVYSGLEKSLQNPHAIVIVAHGGVWYKIQKIFNLPLMKSDNCQIFKIISQTSNGGTQYTFNEVCLKT